MQSWKRKWAREIASNIELRKAVVPYVDMLHHGISKSISKKDHNELVQRVTFLLIKDSCEIYGNQKWGEMPSVNLELKDDIGIPKPVPKYGRIIGWILKLFGKEEGK